MTGYIEVAGLPTWHEVSGQGDPLVLLHGGFVGASSFYAQVPALVEAGYRVHVPERRGHAHTPDVEGPVSYSVMADDTVAYLEQEAGAPADLVGWSDGAVVALLAAQRRPDLVARMVLIGQYYNSSGRVAGGDLLPWAASLPPRWCFKATGTRSLSSTPWPSWPRYPMHVWLCYRELTPSRWSAQNWSIR